MDRIKEKFERFAKSNYKGLGVLTKKALKYIKTEWSAMQTVLQDGNLELSNNLAEQMMRHIKMNLKNCLNIGSLRTLLPQDEDGNAKVGKDIRLYECKNCVVHAADESKVVVQGLDGYIVAEKHGQLLVCSLKEEQRIKELGK